MPSDIENCWFHHGSNVESRKFRPSVKKKVPHFVQHWQIFFVQLPMNERYRREKTIIINFIVMLSLLLNKQLTDKQLTSNCFPNPNFLKHFYWAPYLIFFASLYTVQTGSIHCIDKFHHQAIDRTSFHYFFIKGKFSKCNYL